MRKRRGLSSAVLGLGGGLLLGLLLLQRSSSGREGAGSRAPGTVAASRREPGPGGLLFVGVMTARKYLGTRAKAVYESWGREVPGQIGFFSSEASRPPLECPELPMIALPRVDDSYPPQKKSFLMLQHMWTRYGERFEWFLRADDDLYVRMDRLEHLLRSVDSRRPEYIGQAGRGNSREFGRLSLEYDENFCMGGPGVIMSRETLRRMVPHIKHCLSNLYTAHEDVELGRCVRKFAGVSCTWSYEVGQCDVRAMAGRVGESVPMTILRPRTSEITTPFGKLNFSSLAIFTPGPTLAFQLFSSVALMHLYSLPLLHDTSLPRTITII
jgi:chondroitin sulfate synthase